MGRLENGKWIIEDVNPKRQDGEFVRQTQKFRNHISDSPDHIYQPEPNRYHLYVSYACPWAHRTLIYRKLKNLDKLISVSVVSPLMGPDGWSFDPDFKGVADHVHAKKFLREIYLLADPLFSGRVTVPILWDTKTQTIVNNESADIIRIFDHAFDSLTGNKDRFCPPERREEIDELSSYIYHEINNGVYKAGFATTQNTYEKHCKRLFGALDHLNQRLQNQSFLLGEEPLEVDWRLFVTLLRFDPVYFFHFKCSIRQIADYANLNRYLTRLKEFKSVPETIFMDHIKAHYYRSHPTINPYGIIPIEHGSPS